MGGIESLVFGKRFRLISLAESGMVVVFMFVSGFVKRCFGNRSALDRRSEAQVNQMDGLVAGDLVISGRCESVKKQHRVRKADWVS